MHVYDDINKKYIFKLKDKFITRPHSEIFFKNHCRLDDWRYAFPHRIVNLWNKLPANFVNPFKNRIYHYFQDAGYIYLWIYFQ